MANTESSSPSSEHDSRTRIDPRTAEGRSKILLFGGMGWLAIGTMVEMALVVWGGVFIVVGAFVLNTAGKLTHYGTLPVPTTDQLLLSASWVLLALTVVGLLTNFAYNRYGTGEGSFFWALAVAGVGFGLLHMAAQSIYLPETEQ